MYRTTFSIFAYLFFASLWLAVGCATPTTPDGGPRDNQPPRIDTARSTPNLQTNFEKQPIELTFDEWVTLNDVFQQVLISPPLEYDPDISLKRKTVTVSFDERETLREDATYTINFGEAVRDLTEGNPAEDLRFVFATGPQLDSLRMRGEIVDARSGEPIEEALFLLYQNTADSVVRTERPFYFGKTDSEGKFLIKNIKPGIFKGFALTDENFNYRYDLSSERIGFPDSLLTVRPGSEPDVLIRLFAEAPPLQLTQTIDNTFGLLKLAFNRPAYDVEITPLTGGPDSIWLTPKQDTLLLYYLQETEDNWSMRIERDTTVIDTVDVEPDSLQAYRNEGLLRVEASPTNNIHPKASISWLFSSPLAIVDTSRIQVQPDTPAVNLPVSVAIDSNDRRRLFLSSQWRAKSSHTITLLPGALQDWYGVTHDTVGYQLKTASPEDFGNIQLTVEALDSSMQYVLQLRRGETVVEERIIRGQATYQTNFPRRKPGDYLVRIIPDLNQNGRWDTGSYEQKQQPELIYDRPLERLRANWDLEVTISLSELSRQ